MQLVSLNLWETHLKSLKNQFFLLPHQLFCLFVQQAGICFGDFVDARVCLSVYYSQGLFVDGVRGERHHEGWESV